MTGAVVNAPLVKKIIYEMIKILNLPSVRHDEFIKADIKKIYKSGYAFSDLNKIFVNANIIGKLPKKIKFISDHSSNITANTLFVINQKRNFKLIISSWGCFKKFKYYNN